MQIREGYMPFLEYRTYYRIAGKKSGNKKPLVLLHGGPGSAHDYFEVLDRLAEEDGRELIMYDQLGCGNSYIENHPDLWNAGVWIEELRCLRKYLKLEELHLLGQSWGGMLALQYVCDYKPDGIKSMILSSTLPAAWMWEEEQQRMIRFLPEDMQEAIAKAARTGDYSSPEYKAAETEYMLRHAAGKITEDAPECLRREKKTGRESYRTGWGPNEFTPEGTLKDYDVTMKLQEIEEPALIISGGNDLCTPYIAKYMYDRIPNAEWELFRGCRHMCFVEDTDKYVSLLKDWLNRYDS